MVKKYNLIICFMLLGVFLIYMPGSVMASPLKVSVFNFQATNLESSGYGTTVTNMLLSSLMSEATFFVLDRKELEAFLSLNDLQQNDSLDNVANIGNRLGLNAIVVGTVEKKGALIIIICKVINIEQKRVAFTQQVRFLGDAGMNNEIASLANAVRSAIINLSAKQEEKAVFSGPVKLQKRPGNRRISLSWEAAPNTAPVAYEVFRAANTTGPFAKVAQVSRPDFVDQTVENGIIYYYKIRAYNDKSLSSEFSELISAETALTPNPPVILKTDSHINSIQLIWTPSPLSGNDPARLLGYKLYRSKEENGPYKEVANVLGKDLNIGMDTASTLDKLFKVNYMDRGLGDGETCYYKLTAYNEKNLESDFSSAVKGLALPSVARPAIQGDMIREIRLSWTPLESPFIKGYYVYRSIKEDAGFTKVKKIDQTEVSPDKKINYKDVDSLTDMTRYYYRITAFESSDLETSPSAVVSAQTKGKPPAPEGLSATSGLVKMVELKWLASSAEDVEGYNVYFSRSSDGEYALIKKLEGRNNNKYMDENRGGNRIEDNTTSYYALTSYNKVGVESPSVRAFATTKPRPAKPLGLKSEGMRVKEAPFSWASNSEGDIACYHVFRNMKSDSNEFMHIAKVEGKTFYTDKELKDGVTCRYAVQAEDRDGLLSDLSESITVQTKPRPQIPSGVTGDVQAGKVRLKWNRNTETSISYYTVYEKKFFGPEKITVLPESVRMFSEPAPPKGKSKTYVVTATDKDELESEYSVELIISGK